jgi:hypothetical protein
MMHRETENSLQAGLALEDPPAYFTCQKCLATVQFIRSIMDPVTGRAVRIFECGDCGQRTWDD